MLSCRCGRGNLAGRCRSTNRQRHMMSNSGRVTRANLAIQGSPSPPVHLRLASTLKEESSEALESRLISKFEAGF